MEFLDDLDLDSEDVTEVSVLVLVVVLAIVVVVVLCCHLKKRTDERRKREELVEEAGSFFSFHEALPNSVPSEPGPLATFFKASVFSLSGRRGQLSLSCLLYTSPSPRDIRTSRMPSSA